VAASLAGLGTQRLLGWDVPQLLLALAIANALVAAWIFTIVPEFGMRCASLLLVRTLYRLRARGIDHVPGEGPALLLCDDVSAVDALRRAAGIPPPARFVMSYRIFSGPGLRWTCRRARASPIAGEREDPALMQRAFAVLDAARANGEVLA